MQIKKMTTTVCLTAFGLLAFVAFTAKAENATLHLLSNAPQTHGAMCLDGSPPGYYLRKGSGAGATKWILHLQGGGWCNSTQACYGRSKGPLGSSKHWPMTTALNGFLSDNPTVNSGFYNWNIVHLMYCDGASFAGYVRNSTMYNNTALYYRGSANLKASLDDLLSNGMDRATDVILTGCSAGGLAVYLHADSVGAYLPKTVKKYKAFPDAGFFIDTDTINGVPLLRMGTQQIFRMQNVTMGLNQNCLRHLPRTDVWKCMIAPYTYPYIETPIFVLNSMYDTAQLRGLFGLPCLPPNCPNVHFEEFYDFGVIFLRQAAPVMASDINNNGFYINSCLVHCQTLSDELWSTLSINGTSLRDSFAHWYNEDTRPGEGTRLRDCEVPYNCDQSCSAAVSGDQEQFVQSLF